MATTRSRAQVLTAALTVADTPVPPDSRTASDILEEFDAEPESNQEDDGGDQVISDALTSPNSTNPAMPRWRVTNVQRYKAPYQTPKGSKLVREIPTGIFKAVNTRAELNAHHRQRYYTRKHEAEHKKNMVISVYKEDVLVRVLVSENLPFLCALCGESFAHTNSLKEHAEQVHSFFQAVAKKKPNKPQVIIERSFDPKNNEDSALAGEDNSTQARRVQEKTEVSMQQEKEALEYHLSDTDLNNLYTDDELISKLVEATKNGDETTEEIGESEEDFSGEGMEQKTEAPNGAVNGICVKKKKDKKSRLKKQKRMEYKLVMAENEVKVKTENDDDDDVDVDVDEEKVVVKKRKLNNPTPCCAVCGLKNKTRVSYRRHLRDAHQIFGSAEDADKYLNKLNNDKQSKQDDCLPDEETGIPAEKLVDEGTSVGEAMSRGKRKVMKCDYCETFVLDEVMLGKHMRAHCGLPGLRCDICTEGVKLWEEGRLSEVRGLMEKFLSVDRRDEDVDYVCDDNRAADMVGKSRKKPRCTYSNIVSTCYECGEKYYMRYHMGLHHKKAHNHFTCKECNTTCPSLQALKTHSMRQHAKGIFQCPYCPRAFHDRGKYNYHHAGHMGIYKCPGCSRTFLEKPSLDNHLTKYANHPQHFEEETEVVKEKYSLDKPYIFDGYIEKADVFPIEIACPVCQETFTNSGNLTKHMNAIHPELLNHETNFVCDSCGKMFGNRKNLRSHQKTHVKRFRCTHEGCTKAYHMLYKLKDHLHAHNPTKNFQCDQCDKSFKTAASLRFHRRKHMEDAPIYQCPVCEKTFRARTEVRYHMEGVHGTEKNFQCELCGKRFLTKQRLACHASIHKEKRFLCIKCGAGFRSKNVLEIHERTHNKPFNCKECPKSFDKEDSYRRHLYTKHNIGEPVPKRTYNSSKRKALAATQVVLEEPVQDFCAEEVVNVRVEFPPGQPMTNETLVALIQGLNPLP